MKNSIEGALNAVLRMREQELLELQKLDALEMLLESEEDYGVEKE